jgi:hypothetical protein
MPIPGVMAPVGMDTAYQQPNNVNKTTTSNGVTSNEPEPLTTVAASKA